MIGQEHLKNLEYRLIMRLFSKQMVGGKEKEKELPSYTQKEVIQWI